MQLFFYLSLIFSSLVQIDIDANRLKSFSVKGETYFFGSFNQVYKKEGNLLVQIDKSLDSRVTINAYLFKENDTVFKYGGYGFWSDRNFMYYFDLNTKEWEYYKTIQKTPLEGSSQGYKNQKGDKTIFYGGIKVDINNRINHISSKEIIEFDYEKKELIRKGNLDFPIRSKNLFHQGVESNIFYDTEYLYRVNPFDNTVEVYKKPKVISFIQNVEFDSENDFYIITKTLAKTDETVEIQLDGNFLETPLKTFKLYLTSQKNFLWVILLLVFLILIYLTKQKRKKSKLCFKGLNLFVYGEQYEFESNDVRIIQSLIKSNEMYFNDVMEMYSNPELSYGHNTRITNEKLDRLSIRLKSIFKLENSPINKIKSQRDRRQKLVVLTKEFINLNFTFE